MAIDEIHLNMGSHINDANIVKDVVVKAMVTEGYISEDKAYEFISKYYVTITRESWYKRLFQNVFKNRTANGWYYDVVKFVNTEYSNDKQLDDIEKITDIERLKEMLIEASNKEKYELAAKITERIKKLESKK